MIKYLNEFLFFKTGFLYNFVLKFPNGHPRYYLEFGSDHELIEISRFKLK